jgi:hypothetical protein
MKSCPKYFFESYLETESSILVFLHKRQPRSKVCTYRLIKMYRAGGRIKLECVIPNLGKFSDLGEFTVLEIGIADSKKRLDDEKTHQYLQKREFERGWYRTGHILNQTRRYSRRYIREQTTKTAKYIESLKEQVRQLEDTSARYPTPLALLQALRERERKARLDALEKFNEWEARLINELAQNG